MTKTSTAFAAATFLFLVLFILAVSGWNDANDVISEQNAQIQELQKSYDACEGELTKEMTYENPPAVPAPAPPAALAGPEPTQRPAPDDTIVIDSDRPYLLSTRDHRRNENSLGSNERWN